MSAVYVGMITELNDDISVIRQMVTNLQNGGGNSIVSEIFRRFNNLNEKLERIAGYTVDADLEETKIRNHIHKGLVVRFNELYDEFKGIPTVATVGSLDE